MVDTVRVEVKGLRALGLALKALDNDIGVKIARSVTNAGAQVIKKRAKAAAHVAANAYKAYPQAGAKPIDVDPGNVPNNIVVKRVKSKLTSEHIVTVRGKKKYKYAARTAIFMEFGTVKQRAYPFMRPAFDGGKREALDVMIKRLQRRIARANNS